MAKVLITTIVLVTYQDQLANGTAQELIKPPEHQIVVKLFVEVFKENLVDILDVRIQKPIHTAQQMM